MRGARIASFVGAVAVAIFCAPASASATVNCNLAAGTLTVNVTGAGDQTAGLRMENSGTEIGVYDTIDFSTPPINCGTTPTQANTNSIAVADLEPGSGNRTIFKLSLAGGPFVNSDATAEGTGTKEIEISYDGGEEATDDLIVDGAPGPAGDNWRMGELAAGHGFQLDDSEAGTVDVDDLLATGVEQLQIGISGNPGDDILDARGGSGFTGPLNLGGGTKQLIGDTGDDQIYGGAGDFWRLEGDTGADTLVGGSGNDLLDLAFGSEADTAAGNAGIDNCSYLNHPDPIQVDLRITAPQNTGGAGIDTLSGCEALGGSTASDTLIGTPGNDTIAGGENSALQAGNDTLIGLGGNDTITGSFGTDTVSYAQGSSGPVSVNLATVGAQNTGGAGTDTIATVENIVGSEFADTLTGDGGTNLIDSYDGVADTVDCAGGADSAIADETAVDAVSNCETTDSAPQVAVGATPANGALLNVARPTYTLSADEPAAFSVSVDGGGFTACAASCMVPTLSNGTHTLEFRAKDSDENQHFGLDTVSRTVTIDLVAPVVKITQAPTGTIADPTPTINFTTGDASTVACRIDGAPFAACSGPGSSHTTAPLASGSHTFDVRGTDAAGNSAVAEAKFTVDAQAPETTLKKPRVKRKRVKLRFSANEAGSTFSCRLDKGELLPCTSPTTFKRLAKGKHKVLVVATDALGNTDPTPAKAKFKVKARHH